MTRKIATAFLMLGMLALGGLAHAVEIDVTTFTDEDNVLYGGSDTGCSLREAVQASVQKVPYGGCVAGSGSGDVIQLQAGTYTLTPATSSTPTHAMGPVVIQDPLTIEGAATTTNLAVNLVTNASPTQVPPLTTIKMGSAAKSRVFVVNSASGTGFVDVIITGGQADNSTGADIYGGNGGGIWSASTLSLSNVQLSGNTASGSGGGVFLAGASVDLSAVLSSFISNKAGIGGSAVATTCYNAIALESHSISLQQSLVYGNKTTSAVRTYAALLGCGNVSETLSDSTVAFNDVGLAIDNSSLVDGSLIPSTVGLSLTQVTLIGQSISGLDVSKAALTTLTSTNSVIAFNYPYNAPAAGTTTPNNTNCFGTLPAATSIATSITGNVIGDRCTTLTSGTFGNQYVASHVLDGGNISATNVINPNWGQQFYMPFGSTVNPGSQVPPSYGGLNGAYFPKPSTMPNAILVQATSSGCSVNDQRGAPRNSGGLGCTLGAIEVKPLVPVDDSGQNEASDGVARTVTVPVLANDIADEDGSGPNGTRYAVADLVGLQCNYGGNGGVVLPTADNTQLVYYPSRAVINGVTQPGKATGTTPVVCTYQVQDNKSPTPNTSAQTATVTMSVANIAPIANNDTYLRAYNGDPFTFYPLANDTDPDGLNGQLPPPGPSRGTQTTTALTPAQCASGQYVQIMTQPTLGTVSGAVVMARVLSGTSVITYYNGQLTYQTGNSFSPFTDSFTYEVLDADCTPSNAATVTINVAAPPDGGATGGGSPDGFLLIGGVALAALRRRWRF